MSRRRGWGRGWVKAPLWLLSAHSSLPPPLCLLRPRSLPPPPPPPPRLWPRFSPYDRQTKRLLAHTLASHVLLAFCWVCLVVRYLPRWWCRDGRYKYHPLTSDALFCVSFGERASGLRRGLDVVVNVYRKDDVRCVCVGELWAVAPSHARVVRQGCVPWLRPGFLPPMCVSVHVCWLQFWQAAVVVCAVLRGSFGAHARARVVFDVCMGRRAAGKA
jgi:hypothetical protein